MSMISFGIDFGTTNTAVVGCLTTENGLTTTAYGENNQPFPVASGKRYALWQ